MFIVFEVISRTLAAMGGMFITLLCLIYVGKVPSLGVAFGWLDEVCGCACFGSLSRTRAHPNTLKDWNFASSPF